MSTFDTHCKRFAAVLSAVQPAGAPRGMWDPITVSGGHLQGAHRVPAINSIPIKPRDVISTLVFMVGQGALEMRVDRGTTTFSPGRAIERATAYCYETLPNAHSAELGQCRLFVRFVVCSLFSGLSPWINVPQRETFTLQDLQQSAVAMDLPVFMTHFVVVAMNEICKDNLAVSVGDNTWKASFYNMRELRARLWTFPALHAVENWWLMRGNVTMHNNFKCARTAIVEDT